MRDTNPENLPVIHRDIASIVVFSSDGSVLLGRKAAKGGGVYADSWHLPGGGVEAGEALISSAARELCEEVSGLDVVENNLEAVPKLKGSGATTKVLRDGSRVWCEMDFNYFRLASGKTAQELTETLKPGSDFVELKLFSPQQLSVLPTVPGGIEDQIICRKFTASSKLDD